jgi:hypothetical protein
MAQVLHIPRTNSRLMLMDLGVRNFSRQPERLRLPTPEVRDLNQPMIETGGQI